MRSSGPSGKASATPTVTHSAFLASWIKGGRVKAAFSVSFRDQQHLAGNTEMKLPEVADRLRELSFTHQLPELFQLADEIRRRKATRAPASSAVMTTKLAGDIRLFVLSNPDMTQAAVGRHFNVNPGRVSEIVRGFRT
jgi:hypothetical protein